MIAEIKDPGDEFLKNKEEKLRDMSLHELTDFVSCAKFERDSSRAKRRTGNGSTQSSI